MKVCAVVFYNLVRVVGVAMLSFDASRCSLEGMLDSLRGDDTATVEEREMWGEETVSQEDPVPLPLRPTSRARVPSSVRAKKALGASLDYLAPPGKGSAALLKENIALESPIANLMLTGEPAPKCLSRPFDLASENGHPLAEREVAANTGSVACLSFVTPVVPAVSTPGMGREPDTGGVTAPLHTSEKLTFDERINASGEQPSFSFLTAQEPPQPLTPAAPMVHNPALPGPTPSSGKKWKDDGTLRLKKVRFSAHKPLGIITLRARFCVARGKEE